MENHYSPNSNPTHPTVAEAATEERERNDSSSNSSNLVDLSAHDSSSESDFERFGQEELAEADARRLSEFGSQLASEVLNQVTTGADAPADLPTPNNEPTSPLSTYMDERDLFVEPDAGKAEAHPIPQTPEHQKQQEEALDHHPFHNLEDKVVDEKVEEEDLLGFGGDVPHGQEQHTHSMKRDENELISFEDEQGGAHDSQEHHHHHQQSYSPVREDSFAHRQEHRQPSPPAYEEENFDQYTPSNESGQDTLSNLPSEVAKQRPQDSEEKGIPESSSVTGMRDLDSEESTYDRKGPLTIPASAMASSGRSGSATDDIDPEQLEANKAHNWPRPPTPPKELSEPEEVKPSVVDLGPPPHPHHLVHRASEKGLQSILKNPNAGTGPWIDFKHVDPKVLEIIYWRDPKRSGAALAVILVGLYLFAKCSVLSLVAYTALAALAGTIGWRVFKLVEGQIKKTDGSNPFKPYLEQEITVPQERLHSQVDVLVEHGQAVANHLRHLFLVESLVDSVKFGLLLYTLTYVGAWFSGISLVLLFVLAVFSVPKVYEVYKEPIDQYVGIAKEHLDKVHHQVTDKLPFLKKVTEGEKKEQ